MRMIISDHVPCYTSNFNLYIFASKYWDGYKNKYSLSKAIRDALDDPECPEDYDPFESLVDNDLYATPEECDKHFNK